MAVKQVDNPSIVVQQCVQQQYSFIRTVFSLTMTYIYLKFYAVTTLIFLMSVCISYSMYDFKAYLYDDVDICSTDESNNALPRTVRFNDINGISVAEREKEKKSRKRRSFLETDYTSQVSFPSEASKSKEHLCYYKKEPLTSHEHLSLTTSSLRSTEGEPAFLETKPITLRGSQRPAASKKLSSEQMEMEPDTMETKSVTESLKGMSSILAIRCQSKLEACDCQTVYANCFSGTKSSFDEEITVFEYSCKTSVPLAMPPSPRSHYIAESPLLSPSDTDHSDRLEDTLNQLRNNSYRMPQGFSQLQSDILELMRVLKENPESRGQHHKEICAVQFSENKHLLFAECRKLMSSCQKVIRVDQRPEDMLQMLSGSFQTLVHLASVCLWFTNCIRCQKRHNEVLSSLREIVSTYKEFTMAAEKACGRSCHDLAIKLLARQCTALTASVFCLTQLFRTLTSL
ncbi:UNVERIFIED_CONTAM: hypothetical protein FKN15_026288 [Acipenser sinensis]